MREIKFKLYFENDEEDGIPFMSEPITLEDLLHEDWIEFENENGTLSLPLKDFRFFYEKGKIRAMRVKCGEDYFYIKSDGYRGLEIALSKQCINPLSMSTFDFHFGKHMEFERVTPCFFEQTLVSAK